MYDSSHYNIFSINFIINAMISVTLFAIFLTIFYFTYAAKIEGDIVDIQMKNLVNDFGYSFDIIGENDKKKISEYLNNIKLPDTTKIDEDIEKSNRDVIRKAMIFLGVFSGVLILGSVILYVINKGKIDIKYIIRNNLILITFVALTEIFFLNAVAKRYKSLDANDVKLKIIEKLQDLGK
jgi:hypothetical protein